LTPPTTFEGDTAFDFEKPENNETEETGFGS
jgi:hypothetical protein